MFYMKVFFISYLVGGFNLVAIYHISQGKWSASDLDCHSYSSYKSLWACITAIIVFTPSYLRHCSKNFYCVYLCCISISWSPFCSLILVILFFSLKLVISYIISYSVNDNFKFSSKFSWRSLHDLNIVFIKFSKPSCI